MYHIVILLHENRKNWIHILIWIHRTHTSKKKKIMKSLLPFLYLKMGNNDPLFLFWKGKILDSKQKSIACTESNHAISFSMNIYVRRCVGSKPQKLKRWNVFSWWELHIFFCLYVNSEQRKGTLKIWWFLWWWKYNVEETINSSKHSVTQKV